MFDCFLNGEESGLSTLMERYGDSVTLYVHACIGDLQDAEDLMIEAFSRVCARAPRLEAGGFRPYLYKTARNLALRFAARNRIRRHFGFDDVQCEPETEEQMEHSVQTREQNRVLYLCMDRLNPEYREALYLSYFEEMTHAQVGAVMRKNEKQIENLVRRGRQSLRILLESEGITDAQYI